MILKSILKRRRRDDFPMHEILQLCSLKNLWETAVKSHGCYNLCMFDDSNIVFFVEILLFRENLSFFLTHSSAVCEIHKTSFPSRFLFHRDFLCWTSLARSEWELKMSAIKNLQASQNIRSKIESDCCLYLALYTFRHSQHRFSNKQKYFQSGVFELFELSRTPYINGSRWIMCQVQISNYKDTTRCVRAPISLSRSLYLAVDSRFVPHD